MTAYHAIHESPYDDACPDCTGFDDATPDPSGATVAYALIAILVALFVVGAWMYVKGGNQ